MIFAKRLSIILFVTGVLSVGCRAQSIALKGGSYELIPSPDVWYNSVDGLRLGGRLKGEVPGTFGAGPHRLNLGIWFATKIPKLPVSYFLSFTERIASMSTYDAEGNIEIVSSIRTGYDLHGIAFNKKWQPGYDDNTYRKLSLFLSFSKLFDSDYVLYPALWNRQWLSLFSIDYKFHDKDGAGPFMFDVKLNTGLPISGKYFEQLTGEFQQKWNIGAGFNLGSRLFAGLSSINTPTQMLFLRSQAPAREWMQNGFTRARGTLPPSWFREGLIQTDGGANLRGYAQDDFMKMDKGFPLLYKNFLSTSQELAYPNPLENYLSRIPVVGDIIKMRSYLFGDLGIGNLQGGYLTGFGSLGNNWMADAGGGFTFSIKIPDNLGSMRTITLRYDIPLWLSDVNTGKPHWKFRSLLGFRAVFNL